MTEAEEIELYGADPADWLKRWDAGDSVWTIEMGGLGPGYEQAIHIIVAEILRLMLEKKYNSAVWGDGDNETWQRDREEIEAMGHSNATMKHLGPSGAQWGAAMNIAVMLYHHGPRTIMADSRVKDRHIQVSKTFPSRLK